MKAIFYSAVIMFAGFCITGSALSKEINETTSGMPANPAPEAAPGGELQSEKNIDVKEFISQIESYLAMNPGWHNKGWIFRAVAYSKMEDYKQINAIIAYTAGVEASANKKYSEALQHYEKAVGLDPGFPWAANNLAWLLATCPEEKLRDGLRAVEYSRQAIKVPKTDVPDFIGTLAAAQAAKGDFDAAVSLCRKSIEMWPTEKSKEMLNCFLSQNVYINRELPPKDKDFVSAEGCCKAKWGMCKLDVTELFAEWTMKSNDLVVTNLKSDKGYQATMYLHFKYDRLWRVQVLASSIREEDISRDFINEPLTGIKKFTTAKMIHKGDQAVVVLESDETRIEVLNSPWEGEAVIDFFSKKYQNLAQPQPPDKQNS